MLLFHNKSVVTLTGAALLLIAVSGVVAALHVPKLPDRAIFHFDARGVDRFGQPSDLWGVWGIVAVSVVMNLTLGALLYQRDRILSYILFASAPLLGLFVTLAVATIVSVN